MPPDLWRRREKVPSWEAQDGDGSMGLGSPEVSLQGESPPPGRRSS